MNGWILLALLACCTPLFVAAYFSSKRTLDGLEP